jgi:polar amino acid transport system ATP-binding protein
MTAKSLMIEISRLRKNFGPLEVIKDINLQVEQGGVVAGGQKQRVAIARALAMEPEVMLFDEVTSALDPELVGEVLQTMQKLAADGMTMVIVTHEIAFARDVAERVVFMRDGYVVEEGPAREVIDTPKMGATKTFLSHFHKGASPR